MATGNTRSLLVLRRIHKGPFSCTVISQICYITRALDSV